MVIHSSPFGSIDTSTTPVHVDLLAKIDQVIKKNPNKKAFVSYHHFTFFVRCYKIHIWKKRFQIFRKINWVMIIICRWVEQILLISWLTLIWNFNRMQWHNSSTIGDLIIRLHASVSTHNKLRLGRQFSKRKKNAWQQKKSSRRAVHRNTYVCLFRFGALVKQKLCLSVYQWSDSLDFQTANLLWPVR